MSLDVGLAALDSVYEYMQIDDDWSVRGDRSFTWWLGDLAQQVTASPMKESNGCDVSHFMARTSLLTEVPITDETHSRVSLLNALGTTLSAFVLENNGELSFVSTAVIHGQVMPFAGETFSFVAAMQAAEAQLKVEHLVGLLHGKAAVSQHPVAGPRPELDDLVNIFDRMIVPAGQEPSKWAGVAMLDAKATLDPICVLANGGDAGLSAEFAYDELTSLLRFETAISHPSVGNGLHVTLKLPTSYSEPPYTEAMALNMLEALGAFMNDFQGAWCVAPGDGSTLAYNAFYPNVVSQKCIAENIALKMAYRAKWVADLRSKATGGRRPAGISAIARALGFGKR